MDKTIVLKYFADINKQNFDFITITNKEWYSLFLDEIRNSIAIEGIFANRNDLLHVINKTQKSNSQKTSAILGYFETASSVYEYAKKLFKNNEFTIRQSDLKQIHTLLMRYEKQNGYYKGPLGEYRLENVEVFNSKFTPVNYIYINDVMNVFLKWINKSLKNKNPDKIRFAALSHILFETIHPFRDGNGRTGRIFLSYLLIGTGFLNIAIKGVKKAERERYYDAMETSDTEFEKMLREVEKGLILTSGVIEEYAKNTETSLIEEIITDELSYSFERMIYNKSGILNSDALLPLRDAAKFFNYSQDYLRNLINSGNLQGRKKGKLWYVKLSDLEKYVNNISGDKII
ncbi:MAG: Fic family protein [Ignavibacteriae bacterium]|nr:Fic family protein [Ignavibacteriota bacterium]